jgi:subtilisin family serine protease
MLQQGRADEQVAILIECPGKADLSGAQALRTKEEKGAYVFEQLRNYGKAERTAIVSWLSNYQIQAESFWIVNGLAATVPVKLLPQLAQLQEVAWLSADTKMTVQPIRAMQESDQTRMAGPEWGIRKIQADSVWKLGITGQGVLVAGQDTGFDWDQTPLKTKYKGYIDLMTVDHNYHWHDAIHDKSPLNSDSLNPCGFNSKVPCDDHGHGTHTMGTMVGDDGNGNQIGVAPGAKWISCRNMERGWGQPSTYTECFQWFLAPTDLDGKNPDPGKAPHVINNSWGCPPIEGCDTSNFRFMERAVDALKAAGVVVVVSAGNDGARCGNIENPAAIFQNSFTVGASRQNDTITGFSSRGPVIVDGSGRLKPNVVAPGAGVRSILPDSSYQSWSGTSMAGPHVAGAVALIISANPGLAGQVDVIENLLQETAKPIQFNQGCGDLDSLAYPNNTYGYGRINVLSAVEKALAWKNRSFAPVGATWHYTTSQGFAGLGISKIKIDAEVIHRNKPVKRLIIEKIDPYPAHADTVYLYEENKKISYWINDCNKTWPLYDFTAKKGDTLSAGGFLGYDLTKSCDAPLFRYTVLRTFDTTIQLQTLKAWECRMLGNSSVSWLQNFIIFEKAGCAEFLLPQTHDGVFDGSQYNAVRCYEDQSFRLKFIPDTEKCDALNTTGVSSNAPSFQHTLAPNPASNHINILIQDHQPGTYVWTLYDALGKQVHQVTLNSAHNAVALPALAEGPYWYKLTKVNSNATAFTGRLLLVP